jgi:hypothetical protein
VVHFVVVISVCFYFVEIYFQDYFTYAKVFALIIIVCTGFVNLFNGQTQHFTWDNSETDISVIGKPKR